MQSLLTARVQKAEDKVSMSEFVKAVKRTRKTVFYRDDVPKIKNQSQIHYVCLQMIAGGLLALKVTDHTHKGRHRQTKESASVCDMSYVTQSK